MIHIFVIPKVKGVSQNINYTTIALLPVLTSLFDHIAQHQFGDDVICKSESAHMIRECLQL